MVRQIARLVVLSIACVVFAGCMPVPKHYPIPDLTDWKPQGCRVAQDLNPILGNPALFSRTVHADTANSDEFGVALAPVFRFEWTAEEELFVPEGPSFDAQGNIYFCPLWPGEEVVLVSIDPATHARRWAVPGVSDGGGAPLVLNDPANPAEQIIYVGFYDRAFAIRPDGTFLWDVATGLPSPAKAAKQERGVGTHCFGLNYHPQADAVVGITGDGHLYALDRATGASLLPTPYVFPGAPSVDAPVPNLPEAVWARIDAELHTLLAGAPEGLPLAKTLLQTLLGGNARVANYFAIDPRTGRMWVAGTAEDDVDGTLDGRAGYGVLYGADLTRVGDAATVDMRFGRQFVGGSGSTPTLRADGSCCFVGDSQDNLIKIDSEGNEVWKLPIGDQICGSVAVASDNAEVYASTLKEVVKVVDYGAYGVIAWRSALDAFVTGPGTENFNVLLAGIGANGLYVQTGAGYTSYETLGVDVDKYNLGFLKLVVTLPMRVGLALLDRETGQIRYFAEGREESISVITVGPDGVCYLGQSPVRRAVLRALLPKMRFPPLVGGIGKYGAIRLDIFLRDTLNAATDRAENAAFYAPQCPESAEVDTLQIQALIDQCQVQGPTAVERCELTRLAWRRIEEQLIASEQALATADLDAAAASLRRALDVLVR